MKLLTLLLSLFLTFPALASEPICSISDRDTFKLCNGEKIRLDSIDTPERGEPFYQEARRTLADLLQTRNIQLLNCHTDTTGRRQACHVIADGKDVQAELVRHGMAWDWPRFSKGKYAELENKARLAKTGLWKDQEATRIHWSTRSKN